MLCYRTDFEVLRVLCESSFKTVFYFTSIFFITLLGLFFIFQGLRISVLLAAGFQFFGATLRCVPTAGNWTIRTVLICVGQSLSGLIAPVPLSGGVLLSATWFPSNQRTTSTAIAVAGSFIGNALSFIVGPLMVDDVASSDIPKQGDNFVLNSTQRDAYTGQINRLLYTEAGLTAVLFLGIIVYYPARPPIPPSRSSGAGREDTLSGWKKLLKDPNFLLLALLYGVGTGVYNGWCAVLDQNLSEFGLGQTFAGWLGFIAIVSGAFSGIVFSM